MPFERPTLKELVDRNAAEIETRLPGTDARTRRSTLGVLATMQAGASHEILGAIDFQSRQLHPTTAEDEAIVRDAAWFSIERIAAEPARGNVTISGDDDMTIDAGTELQRSDGTLYTTDEEATIDGDDVTVAVTAVEPGSNGNAPVNTKLSFSSPIEGVNSEAVVASGGITDGTEEESDDSLRARLQVHLADPPKGGAKGDYVRWAREVAGVTRAWEYPLEDGAGTITVRFMTDNLTANGIPDEAKVDEVQAYIDDGRRPVDADVTVAAPDPVQLDFEISDLAPDADSVKAAIEAQLRDLIRREAEPGGTLLLSHIREAISLAAGEHDHTLVTPIADVDTATGEQTVMGEITWS